MQITVIGYGNIGSALATQLVKAGQTVTLTGRDMDKASAVAQKAGAGARSITEAAQGAELVVLAVPFEAAAAVLKAAKVEAGTVVIDITNPLTADYMGLTIGHSTSAAEEIAKALPELKIVKAFNTIFAQVLASGGDFDGRKITAFIAGDDADAKGKVLSLAESLGYAPVDAGGLVNARYLEPLAGLNIYLGYGAGMGTQIAPTWLKRA